MYLKHTKAARNGILNRINEMILREHFLYKDTFAAGFEAARTAGHVYRIHNVPNMFERRHASIWCEDVMLVEYHAGTDGFTVPFNQREIRMLADINIAIIFLSFLSIDTWHKYWLAIFFSRQDEDYCLLLLDKERERENDNNFILLYMRYK